MKWPALLALLQASGQSSSTVEVVPVGADEGTEKRAERGAAALLTPGRWEGSATVTDIEISGAPPDAAAKIKQSLARTEPFVQCLTAKEVRKSAADLFALGEDCRYEHFNLANGHIDAKMQCNRGGALVDATTVGQFSRDSIHVTITSKTANAPDRLMSVQKMTLEFDARRIGKCKGDERR